MERLLKRLGLKRKPEKILPKTHSLKEAVTLWFGMKALEDTLRVLAHWPGVSGRGSSESSTDNRKNDSHPR